MWLSHIHIATGIFHYSHILREFLSLFFFFIFVIQHNLFLFLFYHKMIFLSENTNCVCAHDRDTEMQRVQSQWNFQYLWRSFVFEITFKSYSNIIDFISSILLALSLSLSVSIRAIFCTCSIYETSSLQVFCIIAVQPDERVEQTF